MRIVIVSNRLPVVIECEEGKWCMRSGSGGLVTALGPILQQNGGTWIGWPGVTEMDDVEVGPLLDQHGGTVAYDLKPVVLTAEERDGFYHGFSNEIVWPLFHDLQSRCNFVPAYWDVYRAVQEKFAAAVERYTEPSDFIWVQDYHLMGLGGRLRARGLRNRVGFFLHIPFPPPDIFLKLPWRSEVLEGILEYDIVGLQTPRDRDNFADCVRKLLPGACLRKKRRLLTVQNEQGTTKVGTLPIGIDYNEFATEATRIGVQRRIAALRAELPDRQIILGLDRLDYTKGIPYRLMAFQLALERYSDLHRNVTLLQVVVPSRSAVPEYQDLKAEIERLVSQINGEFTQPGWVPIHHVFRSLEREELLAFYRVADVGFVTPFKDGMNLVAKEYCACQIESDGVLILSEFAGAAEQLQHGAVLVNPYDLDQMAEALRDAVTMSKEERRPAMQRLRRIIRRQDVHWWASRFLEACGVAQPAEVVQETKVMPVTELPPPQPDMIMPGTDTYAWTS